MVRPIYLFLLLTIISYATALSSSHCEVCIKFLTKFHETLGPSEKTNPPKIEMKIREFCKSARAKENRFCYYIGGLEESATGILSEISKPMSYGLPIHKLCTEKLQKKDSQLCDLRYDVEIDLNTVDLKKLRVRDLKRILSDMDETCQSCIEKGDFIKRIEELKPKKEEL